MKINKQLIAIVLILTAILTAGCVSDKEVCNYDNVCTDDETNDCVDCEGVIGRDIPAPSDDSAGIRTS